MISAYGHCRVWGTRHVLRVLDKGCAKYLNLSEIMNIARKNTRECVG
jgi:hypothetical protein